MSDVSHDSFLSRRLLNLLDCGECKNDFVDLDVKTKSMVDEVLSIKLTETREGYLTDKNLFFAAFLNDEKENTYFSLSFFNDITREFNPAYNTAVSFEEFNSGLKNGEENKNSLVIDKEKVIGWETYKGVERMGFIWSMIPIAGSRFGLRYAHKNVTKPMIIQIMIGECYNCNSKLLFKPLVIKSINRWYFNGDTTIRKIIETDTGVRGTLFYPKDTSTKLPAVIDLFGTAGGIMEFRAALLASHGIVCLSLPYFDYKDLPPSFFEIKIEYFEVRMYYTLL